MTEPQTEARARWNEPMTVKEIDDLEGVYFYDDGYAAAEDVQRLLTTLAESPRNATLTEVLRVVEGLADAEWRDCPGACHDVTLAAVLDAVKALQSGERDQG